MCAKHQSGDVDDIKHALQNLHAAMREKLLLLAPMALVQAFDNFLNSLMGALLAPSLEVVWYSLEWLNHLFNSQDSIEDSCMNKH
jgi:hypothetical protein